MGEPSPSAPGPRPYRDGADLGAMQRLASRRWPDSRWHPGGLGWAGVIGELSEKLVLFGGREEIVGWAGLNQPGEPRAGGGIGPDAAELLAEVDPAYPEVAESVVAWLLAMASGPQLSIEVPIGNPTLRAALEASGFRPAQEPGQAGMRHPAIPKAPVSPEGYRVRSVRPGEEAEREEVHRRAWKPAHLPWAPGLGPAVDPSAESGFSEQRYQKVRDLWLYDPDFDLVAVTEEGAMAACCIAWFDRASGTAEIEPLGVAPEHRRRGLAGALCLEVAARVEAAGGHEVFINVGPSAAYPASSGAYANAGFEFFPRLLTYSLTR